MVNGFHRTDSLGEMKQKREKLSKFGTIDVEIE
jgi:hypothetical protein